MARTTIPWGDGSGDNIYLDYSEAEGDQSVLVSSDANGGSTSRTKSVTFSATGVSPVILTVNQAGQPIPWQEYPIECWGIGNIWAGNYDFYPNMLYYRLPLLSSSIKIENTSGYNLVLCFYDSNKTKVGGDVDATASGVYTAPSGAAYFSAWAWDRPPLSIVNNGLLKMYYQGSPYVYPTQKPVMSGSDYLWCVGNISNGNFETNSAYPNQNVRTLQPMQTSILDVDMSQMTKDIKISFFDSSYQFAGEASFTAGNTYTDVASGHSNWQYYLLTMYDRPDPQYASAAPFTFTFR